jgi:glutamyl-tRNA(Gln) amidotransferase subunit D
MPEEPLETLRELPVGQRVRIVRGEKVVVEGTVVPSHAFSGERVVQIKLDSGYNVGVDIEPTDRVERLASAETPSKPGAHRAAASSRPVASTASPIALLTTGGTIASRVDYRTGGVYPVKDEAELLDFFPEVSREGSIRVVPVLDRLSEDLTPQDWELLAAKTVESFTAGAQGVVIAHGTDTMGFTAAALSFLLTELPGPVVLVGAQRSPDRPSSDGPSNLEAGVRVARLTELGEVVVVMHAGLSDDRFAIHRGTRVRKMHSTRRDAFASRNGPPLGELERGGVRWNTVPRPPRPGHPRVTGRFDPRVGILWSYPGLEVTRAQSFVEGLRGVVLAGTGLGHAAQAHLEWIRKAHATGTVVVMTTQCLEGTTDPYVYATGRELNRAGVLYLGDLLPETAYAKLGWALGQTSDPERVRGLLSADVAGEFELRHVAGDRR